MISSIDLGYSDGISGKGKRPHKDKEYQVGYQLAKDELENQKKEKLIAGKKFSSFGKEYQELNLDL